MLLWVKWTIAETSLEILEEKTKSQIDPYTSVLSNIVLEEGSVVNREELEAFHLFSTEKISFSEFLNNEIALGKLVPSKESKSMLIINKNIEIKNLIKNDCKEVFCYQKYISFEYIPSLFWKGLMGIEDKRFLDHHGVDFKSLFRAMVANVKKLKVEQGGSTISQQLVKNMFLTSEKSISRKLKEMVVSVYIESRFPKEKILEAYLNEVSWGAAQGIKIKGVFAASLFYFGKKPIDITPYEASVLVGMLKGPNFYHPIRNVERLKERTKVVFDTLKKDGLFPEDKNLEWTEKEWKAFHARLTALESFKNYQVLWKTLHDEEPTISNYEKFVLLQKVENVNSKIQEKYKQDKSKNNFTPDIAIKVLLGQVNEKNWYSYYSKIERDKNKALKIERHQIGSTIKPIIYSVFQDFGKSMEDEVSSDEVKIKLKSGFWSPKDSHVVREKTVSMKRALLESLNRPIVRVASEIGFEKIEPPLREIMPLLKSPLAEYPAELLGSVEMSLFEVRDSYLKFIQSECGKLQSHTRELSQSVLYILSDPNQTTVEKTVDSVMQNFRFFGKTGTTNNGYDNWYVAFDGKNLTIVWVGYEGQRNTKSLGLYGATTAFNVFQNYYRDRGRRFSQFSCDLIN